jgi:hypothetical protein
MPAFTYYNYIQPAVLDKISNGERRSMKYSLINVKTELHHKVKLISKLTRMPMAKVMEEAITLYAQAINETLKKALKEDVEKVERLTSNE